jgi:hypothetical protein
MELKDAEGLAKRFESHKSASLNWVDTLKELLMQQLNV